MMINPGYDSGTYICKYLLIASLGHQSGKNVSEPGGTDSPSATLIFTVGGWFDHQMLEVDGQSQLKPAVVFVLPLRKKPIVLSLGAIGWTLATGASSIIAMSRFFSLLSHCPVASHFAWVFPCNTSGETKIAEQQPTTGPFDCTRLGILRWHEQQGSQSRNPSLKAPRS